MRNAASVTGHVSVMGWRLLQVSVMSWRLLQVFVGELIDVQHELQKANDEVVEATSTAWLA